MACEMLCCWYISVWKHALGEDLMIKNKLNDKHLDDFTASNG